MQRVKLGADTHSRLHPQFEGVCKSLRIALEPVFVQAISLYDESANLLWLTASVLHEEVLVRNAFRRFANEAMLALDIRDLGYSMRSVIYRVKGPRQEMIGAVMVVIKQEPTRTETSISAHLLSGRVQQALARFAMVLGRIRPAVSRPDPTDPTVVPLVALLDQETKPATSPPRNLEKKTLMSAKGGPREPAAKAGTIRRRQPNTPSVLKRRRSGPLSLYLQHLVPLQEGGRLSRYEVLWEFRQHPKIAANSQSSDGNAPVNRSRIPVENRVLIEVCKWLDRQQTVNQGDQSMLSIKLGNSTLCDVEFRKFVRRCLKKYRHIRGAVGFEIQAATLRDRFDVVAELATSLHELGCFIILDNFTPRIECFQALQLPGVRVVKLAPQLTSKSRSDEVDGGAVAGIIGIARGLGIHTVAKRTRSVEEMERLMRKGFDFVQSEAVSPAVPIDGPG